MLPYLGCAQATHQTAPSWLLRGLLVCGIRRYARWEGNSYPFRVSIRRCVSPSTSKILIVRSLEQVASLRP